MRRKIKEAWLEFLRSGNFKQATGRLKQGEKLCVLGILCLMASRAGVGNWNPDTETFECQEEAAQNVLPKEVAKWAGLKERNPVIMLDGKRGNIGAFNDNGYTLEQIAEAIEKQL